MKLISLLPKPMGYESTVWQVSETTPGVRFAVKCMSLAERIGLTEKIRELMLRHEFLRAGGELEGVEAVLGELLVNKMFLEWGLVELEGLRIDGKKATKQGLLASGPEGLVSEIVTAIRRRAELSEEERKN